MESLTGEQRRLLRGALAAAYPSYDDLDLMFIEELDRKLSNYSHPDGLRHVLGRVINYAEAEGWTAELLTAATLGNPGNRPLRELVTSGGLDAGVAVRSLLAAPNGGAQDLLPGGGGAIAQLGSQELERVVNAAAGFQDVIPYATALLREANRVCRVEVTTTKGTSSGTGFLVGPDLVITNHHVLVDIIDGASPTGVQFRFDYRIRSDDTVDDGVRFGLAAEWRVAASPSSRVDTEPEPEGLPGADELDYALVRLDAAPGREALPTGARRGWLELLAEPPKVEPKLPLLIVQHPADLPIKLAIDTEGVRSINGNATRLTYGVNTLRGSSGSPCFTFDLKLVALHHAGTPEFNARRNEGIPIASIARHLRSTGRVAALEGLR